MVRGSVTLENARMAKPLTHAEGAAAERRKP